MKTISVTWYGLIGKTAPPDRRGRMLGSALCLPATLGLSEPKRAG